MVHQAWMATWVAVHHHQPPCLPLTGTLITMHQIQPHQAMALIPVNLYLTSSLHTGALLLYKHTHHLSPHAFMATFDGTLIRFESRTLRASFTHHAKHTLHLMYAATTAQRRVHLFCAQNTLSEVTRRCCRLSCQQAACCPCNSLDPSTHSRVISSGNESFGGCCTPLHQPGMSPTAVLDIRLCLMACNELGQHVIAICQHLVCNAGYILFAVASDSSTHGNSLSNAVND